MTHCHEQPFMHATNGLDLMYMPTKNYQNISMGIKAKLWSEQVSPFKNYSCEITSQGWKKEQLFLHATYHLDRIYMPTKCYQNISKGIKAKH